MIPRTLLVSPFALKSGGFSLMCAVIVCLSNAGCADAGARDEVPAPAPTRDEHGDEMEGEHDEEDGHDHRNDPAAIPLPEAGRRTLGVAFASAEERTVARTRRIPGRIALRPDAIRQYAAPLPGTLTVEVALLDSVDVGAVIARLESPELRKDQDELHRARHDMEEASDVVRVTEAERVEADRAVARIARRLKTLESANVRRAELESEQDAARQRVEVIGARLKSAKLRIERERHHYTIKLRALSARVGLPVEELEAPAPDSTDAMPVQRWETITAIPIRSLSAGIVTLLPSGVSGWVEAGAEIATVSDPTRWWFEGQILEGDVHEARSGATAALVPTSSAGNSAPVAAVIRYGTGSDGVRRRLDVFAEPAPGTSAEWIQPGISAFAEVIVDGSALAEVAVPREAVVRDGLETLVFRRDPKNPDSVFRLLVEVGADDGRWVAVVTGLIAGDQVVVRGAYALKLASSAQARPKGHMHSDGSFHPAGEGEEH